MSRRRFFVDAVVGDRAVTGGATAAHLARVLRAQPGQEYELACDGRVYLGRITRVEPAAVSFAILDTLPQPPAMPPITAAVAVFKFDRFEWMLEKATELGVDRLQLLATRRTDPRLAAAAPKRMERWRAILHESSQQSRRGEIPQIAPPQPLAAFLAQPISGARLLLSEQPTAAAFQPPGITPLTLLIGPEGGLAPEEEEAATAAGFIPTSLGPRILRCETALLAALVLSAHIRAAAGASVLTDH